MTWGEAGLSAGEAAGAENSSIDSTCTWIYLHIGYFQWKPGVGTQQGHPLFWEEPFSSWGQFKSQIIVFVASVVYRSVGGFYRTFSLTDELFCALLLGRGFTYKRMNAWLERIERVVFHLRAFRLRVDPRYGRPYLLLSLLIPPFRGLVPTSRPVEEN